MINKKSDFSSRVSEFLAIGMMMVLKTAGSPESKLWIVRITKEVIKFNALEI